MGFLDKFKKHGAELKDKAADVAASQNANIDKGIDKAADLANKATKGKFDDKIDKGADAAKSAADTLAGDDFVVVADERLAKDVAQQRDAKRRESRLVAAAGNRMEDIMAQMGEGAAQQTLNLVVKADVHGSMQALREALTSLSNEQIRINVIGSGVGGITESDAQLAATSKATVIGFNVRADASARRVIEGNGVDLRYFSIIYDVIDQVKQVASNVLGKEIREEIIGTAEVRDVFRSSKFGAVAGCMVVEGVVKRSKPIRVLRDSVVVFEGELESLRRFKENVDEVRVNTECGIGVKAYNDVKPGDQIECFERIEVQRTL